MPFFTAATASLLYSKALRRHRQQQRQRLLVWLENVSPALPPSTPGLEAAILGLVAYYTVKWRVRETFG
ncbi:Hypothetical predicted protein [Lecanosticta acicola]|uniref:Uncharacterized protein n=1 Tax=Lecanosticta acicola TaxID=111012 RepID=A0AAI8Z2J1_9PEZI|nr:Hypothetical predicted protein [Lecanosticta acicola]